MSSKSTRALRKFPLIVMVWAAIGINYKSKLYFIDKILNEDSYIKMLKELKIYNELNKKYQKWNYFQQDNATYH